VIAQGVDWPVTTTIVTSDRAEVAFGETLWLFAAVAGKTPTGTVEFRVEADGEPQTICTASISGPPWKAACAVGNVGAVPEPLMITALYSGSSTDFPSESPVFVQKVKPPASGAAIEYHNPRFGDYFLTSAPGEIAQLDADPGAGWQRTGQFFLVEGSAAAGTVPMCRFYSGIAYAPYAAHFYTPFADECASLRAGTTWIYEGTVFPVRPSSDGLCPAGTRPLWRLYDRGQGGAPRHRFTVSQRLRYELWSQGWLEESSRTYLADVCARGAP
jgi:hypothetical protein